MPEKQPGGAEGHVGPFVTFVEHRRPDGHVARWESRRHRKQLGGAETAGSTWWAPRARGWWIAVLFAVGSLLFALGTVPAYVDAVGARWDAVTLRWAPSSARCASSSVPCSSCLSERSPNRRSPSRQKESETPDRSLRCQASMMTGMINGLRR